MRPPLRPGVALVLLASTHLSLLSLGWFISGVFGRLGEHAPLYRFGPIAASFVASLALSRLAGLTYLTTYELYGRAKEPQEPGHQ